jgi:hypothetical protein
LENGELVTERENLRLQGGTGSKTGGNQSEKGDEKRAHRDTTRISRMLGTSAFSARSEFSVTTRKNWIHIGSPQAGPRVAAILSVIESCRRLAIPVRQYLADILPGLAGTSIQNVTGLTPKAWAAKTHS